MKTSHILATACVLLALVASPAGAGTKKQTETKPTYDLPAETAQARQERMQWWTDARFGMFIHWGIYALPARHEWVKHHERITTEDYEKYFTHFNPDLYNPKDWARKAKEAGMKYVVLTTKHHDGFCLWDSKYTDYKATNTPAGRDLIKEFVDAFRAEGIHIGFYYSLLDWHHPDFTIDKNHPQRIDNGTKADYDKVNKGKNMDNYRQYMKDQVRELLTNYGKIDIIWFDFSYPGENGKGHDDWDSVGLLKLARQLQPGIIVDSRLDLFDVREGWDFLTPEQYKVASHPTLNGVEEPWETCQTFSGSWGYHRDETSWKSPHQLIELLAETVSKGGNLIMNVGPTARGEFDYRANDRLDAFAKWMHSNSKSIYNCAEAPEGFKTPEGTVLTYNPKTNMLYIHLLDYPMGRVNIDFGDKVEYAQFLHDASEIKIVTSNKEKGASGDKQSTTYLQLPILKPEVEIPVIELYLKK